MEIAERFVALFTRAWIEIREMRITMSFHRVALFTRAWIEISRLSITTILATSRPLHEGVD